MAFLVISIILSFSVSDNIAGSECPISTKYGNSHTNLSVIVTTVVLPFL